MRRPGPFASLLLAAALAGCAGVVELRGIEARDRRATDRRADSPAPVADSASRVFGPVRPGAPRADAGGTRRVCRAERPAGWIAVAYVPADDCPRAAGDATNTAALVVGLAGQPLRAVLDVCADAPLPGGWQAEGRTIVHAAGPCPGAAPDGRSAVMRIRRAR